MGKYMRKCGRGGIGDLAAMEVSQVVGVRTRARTLAMAAAAAKSTAAAGSSKRRGAAAGGTTGEVQMTYLQLRNRCVVMRPRISGSPALSSGSGRISRSSSNASCEVAEEEREVTAGEPEVLDDLEMAAGVVDCGRERREMATSSCNRMDQERPEDVVSTADWRSRRSTTVVAPSEAEIEEFFAAAERETTRRFADRYNFDVVNEVPLDGRYQWVRVAQ